MADLFSGRGHAVQMQQLVQAEAQDDQHVGVELSDGPACEVLDQMVEAALPAERAGHDFRGERANALVSEART